MNFPWIILGLLTLVRLLFAALGHFNEIESYLLLCSHHLDWGFVEGPAGVPALMRLSGLLGNEPLAIRWLSPFLLLGASWMLWRWIRAFRSKETAFWTVIIFNLLPLANAAGVVMEGTMLIAFFWFVALWLSWRLITSKIEKNKISTWLIFGAILGIGTQVTYQIDCLLPLVILASLNFFQNEVPNENERSVLSSGWKKFLGIGGATSMLTISWLPIFWWNQNHDWLQFQNMTWDAFWAWPPLEAGYFQHLPLAWSLLALVPFLMAGACCFSGIWNIENPFFLLLSIPFFFCINELGHEQIPFPLLLVLTALFLPIAVELFMQTRIRKIAGLFLIFIFGCSSFLLLFGKIKTANIQESPWNFSSSAGVIGTKAAGAQLMQLRTTYVNTSSEKPPFLIAQTPGLASILGAALPIDYPERPGAPSVFIPESPAIGSQFQFWPHYADATAENTTPDPLYTEEKAVSPFLGHDAFYITTEKLEDIPQTITGAFTAVIPLSVTFTLTKNGRPEQLNLYLCQHYQMLSL